MPESRSPREADGLYLVILIETITFREGHDSDDIFPPDEDMGQMALILFLRPGHSGSPAWILYPEPDAIVDFDDLGIDACRADAEGNELLEFAKLDEDDIALQIIE